MTQRTDSVSRRGFLAAGSISFVGSSLMLADAEASRLRGGPKRCILIEMTGGPSHLDSFDPKPDARREIRGPLRAISTAVPGVAFTEGFPHLAEMADQLVVLRSLHHDAAPIHETGQQWLQLGSMGSRSGRPIPLERIVNQAFAVDSGRTIATRLTPSLEDEGTLAAIALHAKDDEAALPESVDHDCAGIVQRLDPSEIRQEFGNSSFAVRAALAHQLLRKGRRFITIPMFESVHSPGTWDIHGHKPSAPGTAFDYGGRLGRGFDQTLSRLLEVLRADGLLQETMVVCVGEMGRTPKLNAAGGRDHWTSCWSALLAGGGLPGGTVIGQSDATGSNPIERPVHLAEFMATIVHQLGINPMAELAVSDRVRPLIGHRAMPEIVG